MIIQLHTNGWRQHVLVDDEGYERLRSALPVDGPADPSRVLDVMPQLTGLPIYVDDCPCLTVPMEWEWDWGPDPPQASSATPFRFVDIATC